jgi:hypothetical protein
MFGSHNGFVTFLFPTVNSINMPTVRTSVTEATLALPLDSVNLRRYT